nr:response regulator transcription factor [uncultured Devosia sp.]
MHSDIKGFSSDAAEVEPRSILLLASRQSVYQSLADAFRQYFRSHDVVLADGRARLANLSTALGLVLISARASDGEELAGLIDQVRIRVPGVPIGLLVDEGFDVTEFSPLNEVEGVLPLSLPLDVLMAVVSLLLAGGSYNPNEMARRVAPTGIPQEAAVLASATAIASAPTASVEIDVSTLTTREEQILQYVSEGFQNKLIADRMALSEHTVKAHVHKVIAKLGVSNRTQAAAAFLRRKDGGSRQVISQARQP